MVTSDLVYSHAQVTEHRCMELKDQSISEDTKRKFKDKDKDLKVRQLKQKVIQGQYTQFYFIKKGVLYRSVVDNGHKF